MAASHASTASCSSERPDSFENSVAPIPTIGRRVAELVAVAHRGQLQRDRAGHVVAEVVRPSDLHLDHAVVLRA